MKLFSQRNTPIVVFSILALTLSAFIYSDYGIAWDEQRERKSGALAAIYINAKFNYAFISKEAVKQKLSDQDNKAVTIIKNETDYADPDNYLRYEDKDYGVVFTLILTAVEVLINPATSQGVYQIRHLTIHIFFLISLVFLYQILWTRFKNWKVAILGPVFMMLSPVIFAHSFFNPKDIPLMSVYIFGIYTLLLFLNNKNYQTALLHAFSCAVLIDMRIPGIILPALTLGFLILDAFLDRSTVPLLRKITPVVLTYIAAMIVFIVAFWPYLWTDPLGNFITAYNNMKKFRWTGKVLFFGEFIDVAKYVPWYYIPGWIMINTPIIYLFGLFLAAFISLKKLMLKKLNYYRSQDGKFNAIMFAAFVLPVLAIIILNSVLYNGWRQVYFVYPPIIVLTICGIYYLHTYCSKLPFRISNSIVPMVVIICCIYTAVTMYRIHPFQNIYFNALAGNNIEERFESDYWGISFRKNLEYVTHSDSRDSILICVENITPAKVNSLALPEHDKNRIFFVEDDASKADYYITKYDDAGKSRSEFIRNKKLTNEVFYVSVDGIKVSSTFKLDN